MNRLIYWLWLITCPWLLTAQNTDSTFKKKALTSLDVKAFLSYYQQEGTHSAVTGGRGDEHLNVYHTGAAIEYGINSSLIIFNASIDIITSPSTDKIDFVKSSASEHDNHVQGQLGYQYQFKSKKMALGAAYSFGIESDYFSTGIHTWFNWNNSQKTRSFGISTDFFFDDLRWGRLSRSTNNQPSTLIYPSELRGTDWLQLFHRNSYNLGLNFRQDVNRRLSMNFSLGATYQEGVLSTPFHRVYFSDTAVVRVELLPRHRIRLPLGVAANWFAHNQVVVKSYYRFYWDNFGILAQTLQVQTVVKPTNKISLYPFVRAYYQTASPYFKPYRQHEFSAPYRTSDYDYSEFATLKAGIGIGWYPDARMGKRSKYYFNNIVLRYSFLYRTDGLYAHVIGLQFGIKK